MFKINLVPEVQEKKLLLKKINTYATIFGIALLSVFVFSLLIIGGIDLAKKTGITSTQKKIDGVKAESEKYKELEATVISLEKGLAGVKQIVDSSSRWTKLLPHLEKATPTDVKYTYLKLADGAIEGTLEAASVESLAKMIESYKQYKVIVLSGPGTESGTISLSVDGATPETVAVNSSGRWIYAVSVDPATNHGIKITQPEKEEITIKYTADSKKVESTDSSVTAESKNLFTSIETGQYQKKDNYVTFDVKINFDSKSIW